MSVLPAASLQERTQERGHHPGVRSGQGTHAAQGGHEGLPSCPVDLLIDSTLLFESNIGAASVGTSGPRPRPRPRRRHRPVRNPRGAGSVRGVSRVEEALLDGEPSSKAAARPPERDSDVLSPRFPPRTSRRCLPSFPRPPSHTSSHANFTPQRTS